MALSSFSIPRKSEKKEDTGLRGTFSGRLYVDKKVFYKRPEVKKVIEDIKNSETIKEQIEKHKIAV